MSKARRQESGPDKTAELNLLRQKFNESVGYEAFIRADSLEDPYKLRVPTGIMQLDLDLGGGIPVGGMTVLDGKENAGKTLVMGLVMAMHQKIYGEDSYIAYASSEWYPSTNLMRLAGVKIPASDMELSKIDVLREKSGIPKLTKSEKISLKESIGHIEIIKGNTAEDTFMSVLEAIESRIFGVVFLDSLTSVMPSAELTKDMDDTQNVRSKSMLSTIFQSKLQERLTKRIDGEFNRTAFIASAQMRANQHMMGPYSKQTVPSLPWANRHGAMNIVQIISGDKKRATVKKQQTVVGRELAWDIEKASMGARPYASGSVYFDFVNGIDIYGSIVHAGMKLGVIQEKSGTLFVQNAAGAEIVSGVSLDEFKTAMKQDTNLEMTIRYQILAASEKTCYYHPSHVSKT